MPLMWNFKKIKDCQAKREKDDNQILDALVWSTLAIGMGRLNEKTAEEFLYRLNRYTREVGAIMLEGRTPVYWTMEMLEPWFGLETNISPLSNAEFDQHMRKLTHR